VPERQNPRCSAVRERMSERSDRSTATKAGITDRRLCDRAENLNDAGRTAFLVGTPATRDINDTPVSQLFAADVFLHHGRTGAYQH
jgi:hypothetical protein